MQVYAIEDSTELEIFVPSSKEMTRYYESNTFSHEQLKKKLESSWCKVINNITSYYCSVDFAFVDLIDI